MKSPDIKLAAASPVKTLGIRDGFNRRFVDAATGQVGSIADTQTARILPLCLGMIPEDTRHDGPYGRITSNWRKENGQFILDATIPPDSSATVILPDGTSRDVGSGSYQWSVTLPAPPTTGRIPPQDES